MEQNDNQLITAYLEGNEDALGILVDRYLPNTYSFALGLVRDPQAAEDIVQESFVKAWKHIRRFVPGNSFRGWLFAIVRNTAIDFLRKRQEVPFSAFETAEGNNPVLDTLKDAELLPDELLARAEDVRYAESLLAELNPAYREVLTLRHTSNMTFEEIGRILGRPLHTVKSQYRRAMAALQRIAEARPI